MKITIEKEIDLTQEDLEEMIKDKFFQYDVEIPRGEEFKTAIGQLWYDIQSRLNG